MQVQKMKRDDGGGENITLLLAEPVGNDVNWKGGFLMWYCKSALDSKYQCLFAISKNFHKENIK